MPRSIPPVRVLHVFGRLNRGGAELRTLAVLERVPVEKVSSVVCVLSGLPGSLDDAVRSAGARVEYCRLDGMFVWRFASLLRSLRIDVVHSHVHFASGAILLIAWMCGVPRRIAHFRSTGDDRGTKLFRRVYRRAMRLLLDWCATDVVGVAEGALAANWGTEWREDRRCLVLYNGVSGIAASASRSQTRSDLGLPLVATCVIQVGRFDPPKNQAFSVAVLQRLPARICPRLVFVGRDATAGGDEVRSLAFSMGVQASIVSLGERSDIASLLSAADVLLLPSLREGLPGVVLEALAVGVPVVANDLPGVREISRYVEGVTILRLEDGPGCWAAAIEAASVAFASDEARRNLRESWAASPFTLGVATEKHLQLWLAQRCS